VKKRIREAIEEMEKEEIGEAGKERVVRQRM